jgi:hypothetical protein
MLRLRVLFLASIPLLASYPAVASNFAVGTCKPRLTSYSNISTAVSSVPPGSTILVCPGVYPEQITISRPLTLQGIASGNQDQVLITVPQTGLTPNVTSIFAEPVAAQVLVQASGQVNISDIVVDGTGGDQACGTSNIWLAGIFYASRSSGEVSRVRASGQMDGGCGVGIWAENGDSLNQSVTIENSSVHDVDGTGIFAGSGSTPTLTVCVQNSFVSMRSGPTGIVFNSVNGAIVGNNVSDALAGVFDAAPAVSVVSNDVINTSFGVLLLLGGTVQANDIANSAYGVYLNADGASVQYNRVVSAAAAGVELNCHSATVAHNTINDALVGLDQVPGGGRGSNTFANAGTITTDGCAAAPILAAAANLNSLNAAQSGPPAPQTWRTPANPFGSPR